MPGWIRRIAWQALRLADWSGSWWNSKGSRSEDNNPILKSFKPGISIIIPERANRDLLRECLASVREACAQVTEPFEVIVIASGSPESDYCDLMSSDDSVRWLFSRKALWFSRAIRIGLKAAQFDWVYLLNNDMIVDPPAIRSLLKWRAPNVFAIASQIYFKDFRKRREETGWTRFRRGVGPIEIMDVPPDDETTVRGTFYAGGGASLFRRDLLAELIRHSSAYDPFYWEDVEWGARAWRQGYQVLFCPTSVVRHEHRATNRKFFTEPEINRIQKRNRLVYHLRNHLGEGSLKEFQGITPLLDRRTLLEILAPLRAARILCGRLRTCFLPFRDIPLEYTWHKYYLNPISSPAKSLAIVVTPYSVYPPSHGAARRLHGILEALSGSFDVVLLSDEIDGYTTASTKYFAPLASVHLTGGRLVERNAGSRTERIANHCHSALAGQLRSLIAGYQPELVQIECVELSKLVETRNGRRRPWLLTLHDVLLSEDGMESAHDIYERHWISQYDAVITCSEEDASLVAHDHVFTIPNGALVDVPAYTPSPVEASILFIGPFRYPPNLLGIQEFLQVVYARLVRRVAGLKIWILGGHDAPKIAAGMRCFDQDGVSVLDYTERPREWLDQCALTINPLCGVRGSCLKVIESLAAGRVCLSTREGARGFLREGFSSLIVTETVEEFAEPLERLLLDHAYRRSLERPSPENLLPYSWKQAGKLQADIYHQCITRSQTASRPGC
jgi:GT2 family glycosyltransferase